MEAAAAAKDKIIPEWEKVQDWFLLFNDQKFEEKKALFDKKTNNLTKVTVELRELRRNRDGKYLYEMILARAPENLFPPSHYYLRYKLADAPFVINIHLDNNEHIDRAFKNFTSFLDRSLEKHVLMRLVTRIPGAPFFNPLPQKRYQDVSFRNKTNIARLINEQYLEGKLELKDVTKLLSLDLKSLQREVYLMLPVQDKEDHEYLVYEKPKEPPKPEVLYLRDEINIQEYEELIFPEKKRKREEEALGYPLPDDPLRCIVCRQLKAYIPCLQCSNKICAECLHGRFLGTGDSYILLHHAYCRHHGKPYPVALPPINRGCRTWVGGAARVVMSTPSGPRLTKRELERERAAAAASTAAAGGMASSLQPHTLMSPGASVSGFSASSSSLEATSMTPSLASSVSAVQSLGHHSTPLSSAYPQSAFASMGYYTPAAPANDQHTYYDVGLHEMGLPDVASLPHNDPRRLAAASVSAADLGKRRADEAFARGGPPSEVDLSKTSKKKKTTAIPVQSAPQQQPQQQSGPLGMAASLMPHVMGTPQQTQQQQALEPHDFQPTPLLHAAGGAVASSAASAASGSQQHDKSAGSSSSSSSKGLRHFSMRVCKKVEEKGRTNYNEVADELVREVLQPRIDPITGAPEQQQFDEKNIRRRVYDALNVLMAMDIISKEKKEIRWKGLPSTAQHDIEILQRDKKRLEQSLSKKREHLQELIMQRIAFKRLIKRNAEREAHFRTGSEQAEPKMPLPFIIVSTSSQTIIQCDMTEDRSDVFLNFSAPFEINDDNEILKRLDLRKANQLELNEYVPPQLMRYLPAETLQHAAELAAMGGQRPGTNSSSLMDASLLLDQSTQGLNGQQLKTSDEMSMQHSSLSFMPPSAVASYQSLHHMPTGLLASQHM